MNFGLVFWGKMHAKSWEVKLLDSGKIDMETENVSCVVARF